MLSCCDSGWWKSENIEINIDDDIDGTNPSSPLGFHACLFVFFCFGAKTGGTTRCIGAKTGSMQWRSRQWAIYFTKCARSKNSNTVPLSSGVASNSGITGLNGPYSKTSPFHAYLTISSREPPPAEMV